MKTEPTAVIPAQAGIQTSAFQKYSGLNLNQDKATKPQTVQIVRQGEATPYWFKVNPLYLKITVNPNLKIPACVGMTMIEYFPFEFAIKPKCLPLFGQAFSSGHDVRLSI